MHAPDREGQPVGLEFAQLRFTAEQASLLQQHALAIAAAGGPDAPGAHAQAKAAAEQLEQRLTPDQQQLIDRYSNGQMAALECCDLRWLEDTALPPQLPSLAQLQQAPACQRLAARNQILLSLVAHRAFAFDLDNQGLVVRVVANFQGGGAVAREDEIIGAPVERSSHAGIALGPHTEAPYHCAVEASAEQSPAPSSLALSALWNPAAEPTRVIPLAAILDSLPAPDLLALTTPAFDYTRSDCFTAGKGANGYCASLLQFDPNGGFAFRYNSYRHTASAHAPAAVRSALVRLETAIANAEPLVCTPRQDRALLINNYRALHCRDVVRDNRRLLVRLFGYSRFARPVVIQDDPLIVKG